MYWLSSEKFYAIIVSIDFISFSSVKNVALSFVFDFFFELGLELGALWTLWVEFII